MLRSVLEGLKSNANVEKICRQHGIHSAWYYPRREKPLATMKNASEIRQNPPAPRVSLESARMKKRIVDLTFATTAYAMIAMAALGGMRRRRRLVSLVLARGISSLRRRVR